MSTMITSNVNPGKEKNEDNNNTPNEKIAKKGSDLSPFALQRTKKKSNQINEYFFRGELSPVFSDNNIKKLKDHKTNFGVLGICTRVLELNIKKHFIVRGIPKTELIEDFEVKIPKLKDNINEYTINLKQKWILKDHVFFAFSDYSSFTSLEEYILEENLTEEEILIKFSQILNCVKMLHIKNTFGLCLHLDSFIYEKNYHRIQLTDIGFSKILINQKPKQYAQNYHGLYISEYTPPEVIECLDSIQKVKFDNKNKVDLANLKKIEEKAIKKFLEREPNDVYQLGVLFYKIATQNKSIFSTDIHDIKEFAKAIKSQEIDYSKIKSEKIQDIIKDMLCKDDNMRKTINELINHINNIDNQEKLLFQKHDTITIGTSEKIKEKIPTVTVDSLYGISEEMIKNRNDRDKIYFLSDELTRMCNCMKSITDYAGNLKMHDVYSKIFKNYGLNKNDINYYQYKFAIERAQLNPESFMYILDHLFSVIINLYEAINVEKQNNEIWKNKNEILSNQYNEEMKEHKAEIEFLKRKVDLYESLIFKKENIDHIQSDIIQKSLENSLDSFKETLKEMKEGSNKLQQILENKVIINMPTIEDYFKKIKDLKEEMNKKIDEYLKKTEEKQSSRRTERKDETVNLKLEKANLEKMDEEMNKLFSQFDNLKKDNN